MSELLYVTLRNSTRNDTVEIIDSNNNVSERQGICKQVPQEYMKLSFDDVAGFLCEDKADTYNMEFTESEKSVARGFKEILAKGQTNIYIPKVDGSFDRSIIIQGDSLFSEHAPKYLESKIIEAEGEQVPYQHLEMIIDSNDGGGFYAR